jgi:hypothetical protein
MVRPRLAKIAAEPLTLDKSSPPHTQSDMNRQHEQKHLLYHRSSCRYCDRPQTPRAVLRVGVASGSQRLIPTANDLDCRCSSGDGKRFVVRADEKLTAFVELESAIQPAKS